MLAKRPILGRLLTAVAVACCLAVTTIVTPAAAEPPDSQAYVKYYKVAPQQPGRLENLTEIAVRFLGSGARSADIYHLNVGRAQPDGSSLTDPAKLNAGWYLVLPWDAAGAGMEYGQIPSGPAPTAAPTPRTTKPGSASPQPTGTAMVTRTPAPGLNPTTATAGCTTTATSSSRSDWAHLRLAVEGAWDISRGNGVMVAVVDSGVDGKLEQLSGRLAVGADVTVGNGRGDIDCLGTGTAMASIIAANATAAKSPVGVAPDATILPVRMVSTAPTGKSADSANAIEVAVSAGATVVALGSYVDLSSPEVVASLTTALQHDVLVLAGAPDRPVTLPSLSAPSATGALLLVGGVDADNKLVERYQPGTVEVVAPGADVASVGPGESGPLSWTGTRFAVAFVAGEAALIRQAYPDLTANQVKQRITGTADQVKPESDDSGHGAGMINPARAVARADDRAQPATASGGATGDTGGSSGVVAYLCLGVVLIAGGVAVFVWLRRRGG
ncbi:S8 family serine peptidase [Micromonospora sp. NPDC050795]|uniref:S8 family serine peptidase n=1 Tax=Micromonospora sp. NPDC050795 TaxID=3364282 RepID=UPI0037B9508F